MRNTILTLIVILTAAFGAAAQDSIPQTGGKMMWVPDSLIRDMELLKGGRYKIVRDNSRQDPTETVVYRGDTIPMVIKERNLGRYDRGLLNYLFIPKGTWQFGLTASYGEFSTSDLEIFDILTDIDLNAHSFAVRPYIAYFIRNNMSVGLRLGYNNTSGGIDSFKVDIDDDINFNLKNIYYHSEAYTTALTLNHYIGLGRRGRFGVSNEVSLEFASGNSTFRRPYDGKPKETFTTYMDARLSFSPGLTVFIMKNASFNVSFGVFGFYLRNEKQKVDNENLGNRLTSGASFKFNIFNIAFGMAVNI